MEYAELYQFNEENKYNHGHSSRTLEQILKDLKNEKESLWEATMSFNYHGFPKYRVRAMIAEAHVKNLEDELYWFHLRLAEEGR